MRLWLKSVLILAAIWLCAGAVILFSRSTQPSAAHLIRFTTENRLEGRNQQQRAEFIVGVVDRLNRLDFDQREELRRQQWDRSFFRELTPEERSSFLEATLPEGFRQLMAGLNKMDPEQRRRIVKRALDDLGEDRPDFQQRISEADTKRVIEEGIGAFYEDASAEVKLDFAPVIERVQRNLQNLR
jgi:hypothetical protein